MAKKLQHGVFRSIISSALSVIRSDSKYNITHFDNNAYLTFYERRKLCDFLGLKYQDFIANGLSSINSPHTVDEIIAYENTPLFKKFVGFMYFYSRTARGSVDSMSELLGVNASYIRQILSEYIVCSNRMLFKFAELYGVTVDVFFDVGSIIVSGNFIDPDKCVYDLLSHKIKYNDVKIGYLPIVEDIIGNIDDTVISTIAGLALNRYVSENNIDKNSRYYTRFGVHHSVFIKIFYFDKFPTYTSYYKYHLEIAKVAGMSLIDFYKYGIELYNDYKKGTVKSALVKSVDSKLSKSYEKNAVLLLVDEIINTYNGMINKADVVRVAGVGFAHLSRAYSKGIMPSVKLITSVVEVFGITFDRALEISRLDAVDKEKAIKELLVIDSPINLYRKSKADSNVVFIEAIRTIVTYLSFVNKFDALKKWLILADIGYSCVRGLKDNKSKLTPRTMRLLGSVLGLSVDDLISLSQRVKNNMLTDKDVKTLQVLNT